MPAFSRDELNAVFASLEEPEALGQPLERQPVHVVYGGAHLFQAGTARKIGSLALQSLQQHAGPLEEFAESLELPLGLAETILQRVTEKLETEPVEDYRLDFEDGYGYRPDAEEDQHARLAALEMAHGLEEQSLPPFIGIRVKPLTRAHRERSARTLDLFLTTLLDRGGGRVPSNFVVTLPKVTNPSQPAALSQLLQKVEERHGLHPGALRIELMLETTECLFQLPALVDATRGRCRGVHFGAYDYTAACEIAASEQTLSHPACDFARGVMQASLAGRGLMLSDGAFNLLPIPPADVRNAWRLHFDQIRRALRAGFYQGWDLHPAQLPARYAALYSFFLEGLPAAQTRLTNFVERAAQATRVGGLFDDAATGQGLLNFFLRGTMCGAIRAAEAADAGVTMEELRERSFLKIVEKRR